MQETFMADSAQFKLTYSTMFNPPPELHAHFDAALQAFSERPVRPS